MLLTAGRNVGIGMRPSRVFLCRSYLWNIWFANQVWKVTMDWRVMSCVVVHAATEVRGW